MLKRGESAFGIGQEPFQFARIAEPSPYLVEVVPHRHAIHIRRGILRIG